VNDYDFLTLSPAEFESLTRELLQAHLGLELERFSSGRDKGIDLRYSRPHFGTLIVQCKRYKTFSSLKAHLIKEAQKISKMDTLPTRYFLTTSASLTPQNKDEIRGIFSPYIKSTGDIWGREGLNDLLKDYPEIQISNYKLWLSSTAVMDHIINADVVNRSAFEMEEIKRTLATYVENESYAKALNLLQEKHTVIISGPPGIGKTTLARVLVYRLLGSKEFDEFIFISESIRDAFKLFKRGKKQIFFFDDFLGSNFLEQQMPRNENSDINRFINHIAQSEDKAIIFTTREYILNQAQMAYESLSDPALATAKLTVDLTSYTKVIRAQILYNHLFYAGLPDDQLNAFLDSKAYKVVVNHEHFNPRLIEFLLKERPWEDGKPGDFAKQLKSYLDKPEKVWQQVYETGITEMARTVLNVLFTLPVPFALEELHKAVKKYTASQGQSLRYREFERAMKELTGTFVRTTLIADTIMVEYDNPSVLDFLLSYFKDKRHDDLIPIIQNAEFDSQFTTVFQDKESQDLFGLDLQPRKISLSPAMRDAIRKHIVDGFGAEKAGEIAYFWDDVYSILFFLGLRGYKEVDDVLWKCVKKLVDEGYYGGSTFTHESLQVIHYFEERFPKDKLPEIIEYVGSPVGWSQELRDFYSLAESYGGVYQEAIDSDWFQDTAVECLKDELEEEDDEDLDGFLAVLDMAVQDMPTIVFDEVYDEYEERQDKRDAQRASEGSNFSAGKPHPEQLSLMPEEVDDKTIDDLFEGLRS
jgi:DNA polymerase III delta prime subunit